MITTVFRLQQVFSYPELRLFTLAVIFYVSLLKLSFQAKAILQIGNNKPVNTLLINDAFNESNASKEQIQTQYELLRWRKFAERVISRLELTNHEEFNSGKYNDKISFLANLKNHQQRHLFCMLLVVFKDV